ncbi:MAG: polysaccharide deacetylase family protein [Epulopiscium sp.]|nr:polysaccharide deacetylase family protein [Candidatus Epulonipiscium sp.]
MRKIKQQWIIFFFLLGIIGIVASHYAYADVVQKTDRFYGTTKLALKNQRQETIPILMYHHLTQNEKELNAATVSVEKFKWDMAYLKQEGYTTLHFRDVLDAQLRGISLPPKSIIITFDDGYRSNYQYAYPILKQMEFKGTIFLIGWSMGRNFHKDGVTPIIPHLTWKEAREMYNSGVMDLQHHTYDLHNGKEEAPYHGMGVDPYTGETEEDYSARFLQDTLLWKEKIEKEVGNYVFVFAYPYGQGNLIAEKILKENGFYFSLLTGQGTERLPYSNHLLSRINVTEKDSLKELLEKFYSMSNHSTEMVERKEQ